MEKSQAKGIERNIISQTRKLMLMWGCMEKSQAKGIESTSRTLDSQQWLTSDAWKNPKQRELKDIIR